VAEIPVAFKFRQLLRHDKDYNITRAEVTLKRWSPSVISCRMSDTTLWIQQQKRRLACERPASNLKRCLQNKLAG